MNHEKILSYLHHFYFIPLHLFLKLSYIFSIQRFIICHQMQSLEFQSRTRLSAPYAHSHSESKSTIFSIYFPFTLLYFLPSLRSLLMPLRSDSLYRSLPNDTGIPGLFCLPLRCWLILLFHISASTRIFHAAHIPTLTYVRGVYLRIYNGPYSTFFSRARHLI